MNKKKLNTQMLLGLINQVVNLAVQFIIIIIAAKFISESELSVFILFISMSVITSLFDFGFSSSIVRNICYILAGANKLAREGISEIERDCNRINYPLFSKLIKDTKVIYRNIAALAFLILFFFGGLYFYKISTNDIVIETISGWFIFASALVVSIFYLYYIPVLTGIGDIQSVYKANIISKIIWLIGSIALLLLYPSLITLSFMFLFSVIINRLVCIYYLKTNFHIKEMNKVAPLDDSTLPYVTLNAYKMGAVSLGSFLINRSTILISGIALPMTTAGQYALSVQIVSSLSIVSSIILSIKMPDLAKHVLLDDKKNVLRMIILILIVCTVSFFVGLLFFLIGIFYIIPSMNIEISFLPIQYLLLYVIIVYLEMNHSICATILTTQNKVPFVKPALISGVGIVISSIFFSSVMGFGVLGLIVSQGLIQLVYNNWKWPLKLYKEMMKF